MSPTICARPLTAIITYIDLLKNEKDEESAKNISGFWSENLSD